MTEEDGFANKWEFLFACAGVVVTPSAVWRFPYLIYQYGAEFIIIYAILLLLFGLPMVCLELTLGKFVQGGPIKIWKMCPFGVGVGIGQGVYSILIVIYYNLMPAYCLYYIFASFSSEVPWTKCENEVSLEGNCTSPEKLYFENTVLGSDKADWKTGDLGGIKWDLCLCLLLAWTIVCACIIRGIKFYGKIVYVTTTLPLVLLIVLTIFVLAQDGAAEVVKEAFSFKSKSFSRIYEVLNYEIFEEIRGALSSIVYSLSLSSGWLITFGGYNRSQHSLTMAASSICLIHFFISIVASLFTFGIWGIQMHENIFDIETGFYLGFIEIPKTFSQLPATNFTSIMFFSMMFLFCINTASAYMLTILSCFYDLSPVFRKYKTSFTMILFFIFFILSLPCVTLSGKNVFSLMDQGMAQSIFWIMTFEILVACWLYGAWNIGNILNIISPQTPFVIQKILVFLWYFTPFFLIINLIRIYFYYYIKNFSLFIPYGFPDWTYGYSVFLFLIPIIPIPIWAIFHLSYNACKTEKKVLDIFKPDLAKWRPAVVESEQQRWLEMNESHKNGEWRRGLFGCGYLDICCKVIWCPSCHTYTTADKLGKNGLLYAFLYCLCPTIPIILLRNEARQKAKIRGSIHDDIMTSYFCGSCVMCQTAVQAEYKRETMDFTEMNSV